jgi:hypothetical protein
MEGGADSDVSKTCVILFVLCLFHENDLTDIYVQSQGNSAGIFKQSMAAGSRVGIGLPYRPARLHRLAELVSWNRFLGSLKV